ncbi:uncharacterized protein [Mytilus edulis]|uniref:uncharacterized protein n=1 Tax=Mytilus edulis TaxID=6550 RepID=UPI0039EFCEB0
MNVVVVQPVLEYSSEVWDNCRQLNSERLEKLQLEAARIVTGLTSYASTHSLYLETGWEKLKVRREVKKLTLFYKILKENAPEYLLDLIPPTVAETNNYNLRSSQNIYQTSSRLSLYQESFIPSSIKLWNSLDLSVRFELSLNMFKLKIKQNFETIGGTQYRIQYYCCNNAIKRNGTCKPCPEGYSTDDKTEKCSPCSGNQYGENCGYSCFCSGNERCDNVVGCVANPTEDKLSKVTDPLGQGINRNDGSSQSNSVVVYMSCIATIGSTVVIIIALYRNQDWIKKRLNDRKLKFPRLQKGTVTISGKKQKDEPTARKSEHIYDDINEKNMIKNF